MSLPADSSLVPYEGHGVRFLWPDIWELQETVDGADTIITVSSETTCFWTLRILPGCPPPPQVVESCSDAFVEEYDDVDVTSVECSLAEMPAFARDVEFSCLELFNTVALRSVRTTDFTLLVWWQGTDHELVEYRDLLERMTQSVRAISLLETR